MTETMFGAHDAYLSKLPPTERANLLGMLFNYVFRGVTQNDIRIYLVERDLNFDFLAWRLRLHSNGTLLKRGKIFLYAQLFTPIKGSALGLSRAEQNQLLLAMQHKPLVKTLTAHKKAYPFIDQTGLDKIIVSTLLSTDYQTYVRKFIHRKLSFIYKSYGWTPDQIESELTNWALYGLLRAYPCFANSGHAIAIAKTLAKRRGHNLIDEVTSAKNNELIKISSGFESTTVSLSAIQDGVGQFITDDGTLIHRSALITGIEGKPKGEYSFSTLKSVRSLCHNPLLKERQRRLLHLMLGYPSKQFSTFLGVDNSAAVHEMSHKQYFHKVCQFMEVSETSANKLLQNLKPFLG